MDGLKTLENRLKGMGKDEEQCRDRSGTGETRATRHGQETDGLTD